MNEKELTKFGSYEKRDRTFDIPCLASEYKRWKKKHGRKLGQRVRQLLERAAEKGKQVQATKRPPRKTLSKRFSLKCSESELFYWRMACAKVRQNGNGTLLRAVVCHLLNRYG